MTAQAVLDFWFVEHGAQDWFAKQAAFDAAIAGRFLPLWRRAAQGELDGWRCDIRGRLAEIIVLDQFSRNLFRNSPQAYAQDGMALVLAQEALAQAEFAHLAHDERQFLLMPLMHSESAVIHARALSLFERYTNAEVYAYEVQHKDIIDRFGRYPHRNAVLGRQSSAEEAAFLQSPGSSF